MKFSFLPKSRLGKWSVGLGIGFLVLLWLKMQFPLPVPSFGIAGIGLAGFATAVITIIKKKDVSVLLVIPILLGLLLIIWITAEIMYPH